MTWLHGLPTLRTCSACDHWNTYDGLMRSPDGTTVMAPCDMNSGAPRAGGDGCGRWKFFEGSVRTAYEEEP